MAQLGAVEAQPVVTEGSEAHPGVTNGHPGAARHIMKSKSCPYSQRFIFNDKKFVTNFLKCLKKINSPMVFC
jgi:hypothetical protein